MADLPTVTVTGQVPLFSDPFAMDSWGLTDYLGGLSLNAYSAGMEAVTAVPVVPEVLPLLPEVVVTGAKAVVSQLTPLGLALAMFTPTPVASQDQENILLDQVNAWKNFLLPRTEIAPPSSPLPPPPVTLPEVVVSPPPVRPRPDIPFIIPPPIVPELENFYSSAMPAPDFPIEDQPVDIPVPEIIPIPEKETKISPPVPGLGGAIPIGLPTPGGLIDTTPAAPALPVDVVFDALAPLPPPGDNFIPIIQDVPNVGTVPRVGSQPAADIPLGLDFAADSVSGSTRTTLASPAIPRIGDNVFDLPAVDVASPVRPPAITTFLDVGTGFAAPFAQPLPFPGLESVPETAAVPRLALETERDCDCAKPKKKKKKPTDRTVCYRGTYKQNRRGITFNPKEEVPCEAKTRSAKPRAVDPFGRPQPKTRGKRRTPTWQDTINDVFYPKP